MGPVVGAFDQPMRASTFFALGLSGLVLSAACNAGVPNAATASASGLAESSASASTAATTTAPSASAAPVGSAEHASSTKNDDEQESRRSRFASLVNELSEPDTYFFSDNIISNETSYLQVSDSLPKLARPEGVYLGVGPEQNFSYIAMTKPRLAFIVDIRRQNLLMHLIYKAAFDEARSRSHFLSLVLGRDHDPSRDGNPGDGIDEVIKQTSADAVSTESYARAHATLMKRIETYGVTLSDDDRKHLDVTHKAFFDGQLEIKFALKEKNGRTYPSLRDLLGAKSPAGKTEGFLASEDAFRFLQTMEREHRIIPLVGDFAGDKALPGLAAFLQKESLTVSTYYVSNVEQYLLEPKVWSKWVRNIAALPKDDSSLFIRCYLDQGKKHPKQMKGHRAATVLQRMKSFEKDFSAKKTTTLWDLSTEDLASP
jgi:hypothetical protein